jgi:hypothetical protein
MTPLACWDTIGPALIHHKTAPCTPTLEVCSDVPVREFEPGAIFLADGETSGMLYILIDGEVEIVNLASPTP